MFNDTLHPRDITKLHMHHMQFILIIKYFQMHNGTCNTFSNEIHVLPIYHTRLLNEPHKYGINIILAPHVHHTIKGIFIFYHKPLLHLVGTYSLVQKLSII